MIETYISHLRNREYMSGIERDRVRVKATGEVFTPTELVREILDAMDPELFSVEKTFIDNSCGDGQFLSEVLIKKLERIDQEKGVISEEDFGLALASIYGVDLMIDNVELCRERLLCGFEKFRRTVESNIVQANALEYDYKFKRVKRRSNKQEEIESRDRVLRRMGYYNK